MGRGHKRGYWLHKIGTPIQAEPLESTTYVEPSPPPKKERPPPKTDKTYPTRFCDGRPKPNVAGQYVTERVHAEKKAHASKRVDTPSKVLDPIPEVLPDVLSMGSVSYAIPEKLRTPAGGLTPCTPIIAERMALLVASGVTQVVAIASMGLPFRTVEDWNAKGRRDIEAGVDSPYANFWRQMLMAKGSCEANWVSRVNEGAMVDWRAAAFLLERRFGIRWAPKNPKDKPAEGGELNGKSTAELQALLQTLMAHALPANNPPPADPPITVPKKEDP